METDDNPESQNAENVGDQSKVIEHREISNASFERTMSRSENLQGLRSHIRESEKQRNEKNLLFQNLHPKKTPQKKEETIVEKEAKAIGNKILSEGKEFGNAAQKIILGTGREHELENLRTKKVKRNKEVHHQHESIKNRQMKPAERNHAEEVKLNFDPPLPYAYSMVDRIMPNGTRDELGYVAREEYNNGKDVMYFALDYDHKSICYPSSNWKDMEAGFQKYAKRLARQEQAKEKARIHRQGLGREEELKQMRQSKADKNRGIELEH